MDAKRKAIREALQGKPVEIPPPRFVVTRITGETDEQVKKIVEPKIEAAKKRYYENYKPGDEGLPIMVFTFDTPF